MSRQESSGAHQDEVTLQPIEHARAATLSQLFELYAHDFSEHVPLQLEESGRFSLRPRERWWTEPDHHPFFVRSAGRLAGFALVSKGSQVGPERDVMDVAEFFVVRGERRKLVGQRAAHALLARFPGRWEVRVRHSNQPALTFWTHALQTVATPEVSTLTVDGVGWTLLRLLSG
jgi:predicted acetyltransferase